MSSPSSSHSGPVRLPHSQKAKQQGVSTKTLDRWAEAGIIDPPEYINGRKYHSADSQPRHDRRAEAAE